MLTHELPVHVQVLLRNAQPSLNLPSHCARRLAMPLAYSEDLRWRAVWLHVIKRKSYAEIGNLLYMREKSVQRYIALFNTTGSVAPRVHKHGPDRVLSEIDQWTLIQSVIHTSTIFLHEMQNKLSTTTGRSVHILHNL